MDKIKVSVCCITYNQKGYIRQALDSFINQNTNFKYEIIVHDDASTDGTTDIVKEYAKKYPKLIVPVIEKENIYVKSPNSIVTEPFKVAKGEYIAICDGDDAWTNPNKLQMQVDYMDKHPEISLCTHNTKILGLNDSFISNLNNCSNRNFTLEDLLKENIFVHTSSLVFKNKDIKKLPNYFNSAVVADLPLKLHLLTLGNGYYFKDIMSIYRTNAIGSWNSIQRLDIDRQKRNHSKEIELYNNFNNETNYKYNKYIKDLILKKEFNFYIKINDINKIKDKKYRNLYKRLSLFTRIKLNLKNNKLIYSIYKKSKRK